MLPVILGAAGLALSIYQTFRSHKQAPDKVIVGADGRRYEFDGYLYHLPRGVNWRTAADPVWDFAPHSPRVRPVGQRVLNGMPVNVYVGPKGDHFAACPRISEGARVAGVPHSHIRAELTTRLYDALASQGVSPRAAVVKIRSLMNRLTENEAWALRDVPRARLLGEIKTRLHPR